MQHLAAAVGGKHAVGAQRDEYAVQPRFQQRVRRTAQARIVRNGHAGQQLRLYAVGLESVEPAQHGAELLRLGADNKLVNLVFFRKVSRARLLLESMIYAGMGYFRDGKITVATVTLDMMAKAGATEDDCDDLAGLAGRAEESVVSITIKEQADGNCKISVRSNPEVSSSQICAVFGGGGHDMAAGCTIMGTPEKARELLLQVIDEVWK